VTAAAQLDRKEYLMRSRAEGTEWGRGAAGRLGREVERPSGAEALPLERIAKKVEGQGERREASGRGCGR
jgi:hypothetical protein